MKAVGSGGLEPCRLEIKSGCVSLSVQATETLTLGLKAHNICWM